MIRTLQKLMMLTLISGMVSCSSVGPAPTAGTSNQQIDAAIANAIIREINNDFGRIAPGERIEYLQKKIAQFDRSVDLNSISGQTVRDKETLDDILALEVLKVRALHDYPTRIERLTSISRPLREHESQVLSEINRLDQILLAQYETPTPSSQSVVGPDSTLHMSALHMLTLHMSTTRAAAIYPVESFDGKQDYLDRLSNTLVLAQIKSTGSNPQQQTADLVIEGIENSEPPMSGIFHYQQGTLSVDLTHVSALPSFEIPGLAIYYGFPGVHAQFTSGATLSISRHIDIPGIRAGWAGFVLDEAGQHELDPGPYIYLSRLLAGLALADLKKYTGDWTDAEATEYLLSTTPYSIARIKTMLHSLNDNPGLFLAGLIGKVEFRSMFEECLERAELCVADFQNDVLNAGPSTFNKLRARFRTTDSATVENQ